MYSTPTLATRFARNTFVVRSETPLAEDQMRRAAPSIFAAGKHGSRSERYTYIPTIDVLRGLRKEGFEPFMVAQSKSRIEGKTEFTKHMIRMRHAGQVTAWPEANEIILINSHDGASSYQMLAGAFRFVCCNGLVVGTVANDIRIPHKGNIQGEVIEDRFFAQWGLAFKLNTDDMREAPSRVIVAELTRRGAKVRAYDPVAAQEAARVMGGVAGLSIVDWAAAALQGADALAIVTEWKAFRTPDFEAIRAALRTPVVFDGRNLYEPSVMAAYGLQYHCIGRIAATPLP